MWTLFQLVCLLAVCKYAVVPLCKSARDGMLLKFRVARAAARMMTRRVGIVYPSKKQDGECGRDDEEEGLPP